MHMRYEDEIDDVARRRALLPGGPGRRALRKAPEERVRGRPREHPGPEDLLRLDLPGALAPEGHGHHLLARLAKEPGGAVAPLRPLALPGPGHAQARPGALLPRPHGGLPQFGEAVLFTKSELVGKLETPVMLMTWLEHRYTDEFGNFTARMRAVTNWEN